MTHLMSHLNDCQKEIQVFCNQLDKALIEMGSKPRDQKSILDSQNSEFEMGNNENKVDNNKDVDNINNKGHWSRLSQLWH